MTELTNAVLIAIFVSFPEVLLMLLLGFSLSAIKFSLKQILIISFIQTIIAFAIEFLNISFGIHTVIQLVSLWFLVTVILKMKLYKSIIPVLIGFFIQGIIQGIYLPIISNLAKLDFIKIGMDFKYTLVISLPIYVISITILLIIIRKNFTLCSVE